MRQAAKPDKTGLPKTLVVITNEISHLIRQHEIHI